MATSHGIVIQSAPTTIGTQNFTKAGLGTVKGALVIAGKNIRLNSASADVHLSFGMTHLTSTGFCLGGNYEDGEATSDAKSLAALDHIVSIASAAGLDTRDEEATFNATVTDGIQLNWDNIGDDVLTTAILIKEGVDNFHTTTAVLGGTGATSVSAPFTADCLLTYDYGKTSFTDLNSFVGGVRFYDVSADTYGGIYWNALNNDTAPDSAQYVSSAQAIGGTANITNGTLNQSYTLGNFTGTGFTATKVSGTEARAVGFALFKLASGYKAKVDTFQTYTSAGTQLLSTDFEPQIVFVAAAQGAAGGNGNQCSVCIGFADADEQFVWSQRIEDSGGATQNSNSSYSMRNDTLIYLADHVTGNPEQTASRGAFNASNWALSFSTSANAATVSYLAIGQVASATGVGPQAMYHLRNHGRFY